MKLLTDFRFLWLEQMLEIRNWYWYFLFSIFLPLLMVFGFSRMGGVKDSSGLLYIITGSAIFSVANDALYKIAMRVAIMRRDGVLLYYTSLPVSKAAFVLAMALSRIMFMIPGAIMPIVVGHLSYNLNLEFNLWIIVLLPLITLSLSVLGVVVGILIESLEVIQFIVNLMLFVLVMIAPVFIPMEALPAPLQILSYILPPTYAADALRLALTSNIGYQFYTDLVVLVLFCIASFVILSRWMRWQAT